MDDERPTHSDPVAVMFADISGSTEMYAVRGDTAGFRITSGCIALLEHEIQSAGGTVIKRLGDGLMATFLHPDAAIHAAIEMQRALEQSDTPLQREGVRVRAGISYGVTVYAEGDIFGDVVNIAARLVSLAAAGEIVLADAAHAALTPETRRRTRRIEPLTLRGRPAQVDVYEYLWKEGDGTTRSEVRPAPGTVRLEMLCAGTNILVDRAHPKVTIGRGADNDITLPPDVVSRYHAEVALRGDQFLITDRSTNGTYVHTDTGDVFRIIRDELTLTGSGRILPGSESIDPIWYRVVRGRP